MITAHVPTQRPKLVWQDVIKSKEDYTNLAKSGMMYVYFPDITWKEVDEYLKTEEKEVVAD
jgi:hypothetical protein